jgi:chromosome segregation ATPase
MISLDPSTLQMMAAIIDFVQNPKDYKALVVQLQDKMDEHQEILDALTEGKSIAAYKAKVDADVTAAQDQLQSAKDSFSKATAVKERQLADKMSTLADREVAVRTKEQDLASREAQLVINESKISNQLQDQALKQSQLDAQEADLVQREQALKEKAQKVQALVGG